MPYHSEKLLSAKRTRMFRMILIVFLFTNLTIQVKSQDTATTEGDSVKINSIDFSSSKFVNTFLLSNRALFELDLFVGKIILNQKYNGSSQKISNSEIVNMDYEEYDIKFMFPIWDSLNFVINQNLNLYSVTRDIGINKMEKFNGTSGFRYNFNKGSFLELKGGAEQNKLLGISYLGKKLNVEGKLTDINIEDYNIQSNLKGNYIDLTKNRKNMDLDFSYSMIKKFDEFDIIDFNLNYKVLYLDNLPPIQNGRGELLVVETRNNNELNSKIKFDFAIFNSFYGLFDFSIQKIWIDKFYKQYYDTLSYTGITRKRNDLDLSFLAEGKYKTDDFFQIAGMYFNLKTQDNTVLNTYNLNELIYNLYKNNEEMFNMDGNTTRFYSKTYWEMSHNENFKFDYSVSLYQHDTPSKEDNNDRDEFTSIINTVFTHKFSEALEFSIEGDIQLYHYVYIKSKMSADNKWRRDISLKPHIIWSTSHFTINPQFELYVKYINYDFEGDSTLNLIGSSDRQIGYKDSIIIILGKMLSLQTNINLRYFERGILFWKTFSESPQSSSMEGYVKSLLYASLLENQVNIGCGIKYYSITQNSLINIGNTEITPGNYYVSVGPEIDLKVNFSSGSSITFQGCYEFQNVNNIIFKTVPIFFLTTKIVL